MAEISQDTLKLAGADPFAPQMTALAKRRAEQEQRGVELAGQQQDISARQEDIVRARGEESAPVRERMGEKLRNPPPTDANEERVPDFKRPTMDPKELQQSFAMLMAASMLVGVASRAPFHNTMAAMTGAMEGFVKQDALAVRESLQTFDRNVTAIKERNAAKRHEVETAWRTHQHDLAALKSELELIAAKYDDPMALMAARSKSITEAQKLIETNIRSTDQTMERLTRDGANLQLRREQMEQNAELKRLAIAARGGGAGGATPAGAGGAVGGGAVGPQDDTEKTALRIQAWNYINTKTLPYRKGTGGGADRNNAVMREVAQIANEMKMSPEELSAQSAEFKSNAQSLSFQTKKLDAIQGQLESFHNNIDTWLSIAKGVAPKLGGDRVKELAPMLEKVNFIGVRSADDIKLRIQEQINDPSVSALLVSAMAVATDYARIMQGPQSIASLTEGARKDAQRLVAASADEKGRAGIVAALESDTAGQVKGLETQVARTRNRLAGHDRRASDTKGDVPDIEAKAKAAWGAYEPDVYSYRIGPNGKLQRSKGE